VGRPAGLRAKEYAGRASVFSPHKVCGARRASPRCASLMRVGPKRVESARIAIPSIMYLSIIIQK